MINTIKDYKQIAFLAASFSTCCKKKVGAAIVDNNKVVAVGYNKSINIDCTNFFLKKWEETDKKNFLSFYDWCQTDEEFKEEHRNWSKKNEIHAEIDALNYFKADHYNYSMVVTLEPCLECAKAIIKNKHINKVYYINEFKKNSGVELLKKNFILVEKI